jgi:hypothetical protein
MADASARAIVSASVATRASTVAHGASDQACGHSAGNDQTPAKETNTSIASTPP